MKLVYSKQNPRVRDDSLLPDDRRPTYPSSNEHGDGLDSGGQEGVIFTPDDFEEDGDEVTVKLLECGSGSVAEGGGEV